MKRWSDGSLAKHLSDLQARHYEDDTPARDGEVRVLLSSIWPEADVVEGLTQALRRLVDAVEDTALEEHPHYVAVEAAARCATAALEAAELWQSKARVASHLECAYCGGIGRFTTSSRFGAMSGQEIVCSHCEGTGYDA